MPTDDNAQELLGEHLKQQYDDYYGDAALAQKRALAARDSVAHMAALVDLRSIGTLLDVGAGEGSFLARLGEECPTARLFAVEISESGLAQIRKRDLRGLGEAKLFDGYKIPYPDKSFDVATAIHVLEHVEHERLFLTELRRVARRVVIEVPLENGLRVERSIRISAPYGHINYYNPEVFLNLVRTSGFTVLGSSVRTSSLQYEQFLYGVRVGFAKNALRRIVLRLVPRIAVWSFNYLLTVYCEPNDMT